MAKKKRKMQREKRKHSTKLNTGEQKKKTREYPSAILEKTKKAEKSKRPPKEEVKKKAIIPSRGGNVGHVDRSESRHDVLLCQKNPWDECRMVCVPLSTSRLARQTSPFLGKMTREKNCLGPGLLGLFLVCPFVLCNLTRRV